MLCEHRNQQKTKETILKWLFLGIAYFCIAFTRRIVFNLALCPVFVPCSSEFMCCVQIKTKCQSMTSKQMSNWNIPLNGWNDGTREHGSGAACCCDVKRFAWRLTIFQFIFIPKVTFHCNAWRALILKSHEYAVAVAVRSTNSHPANVRFVKPNVSAFAIKRTQSQCSTHILFVWIEYERRLFVGKCNELSFLVMKCLMATASITLLLPHMCSHSLKAKMSLQTLLCCCFCCYCFLTHSTANIHLNNTWWQCVLSIFSCE